MITPILYTRNSRLGKLRDSPKIMCVISKYQSKALARYPWTPGPDGGSVIAPSLLYERKGQSETLL